ncbi:MAG TPA: 3-hydroxyacyl-CoA dehydrogenase NAD-binding domain-containing protein [Polyangia bacterium]|jgi:3-hydroxybutyryl-CoA dehydrogenase|nr:3-hydroxyacyl-CoA dehydrogenase NAD-binding domain-containing protein [Polyangia bacterium]
MTTPAIERLAVIGAGQMGRGIAQLAACRGLAVILVDSARDVADRGRSTVADQLQLLVEKKKLTVEERDAALARIHPADIYGGDLEGADFVIEAATESFDTKSEIFSALDQACRPGVILATNTSSISITAIGAAVTRPDRVIGMHFMNPPPLMKLVEIIRGLPTSEATYEATRALAERLGKTTVLSRDIPGFVVNRILMPMLNEACFALYEGIAVEKDIDVAIQLGLNHPMGPCALMDLIGLDTTLAILEVLHRELGDPKYRPCPLLRQYVAAGWLGRKTGRGFYQYPPASRHHPAPAPVGTPAAAAGPAGEERR